MRGRVREATEEDIHRVSALARDADVEECWTAARLTPASALRVGLDTATSAWVGEVDDTPVCMFGVSPMSLVGGIGVPWMVGTTELERHQFAFLRRCRERVAEMSELYPVLANYVDARNTVAIRWLRWLGFKVEQPEAYGPDEMPFHYFHLRREHV